MAPLVADAVAQQVFDTSDGRREARLAALDLAVKLYLARMSPLTSRARARAPKESRWAGKRLAAPPLPKP